MKEFYVTSKDEEVKTAKDNATMVCWKNCTTSVGKCPGVQYFLAFPISFNIDEKDEDKYIINFPTSVKIDEIREHIHRVQSLCRYCSKCTFSNWR